MLSLAKDGELDRAPIEAAANQMGKTLYFCRYFETGPIVLSGLLDTVRETNCKPIDSISMGSKSVSVLQFLRELPISFYCPWWVLMVAATD